jgi:hypothetical protein
MRVIGDAKCRKTAFGYVIVSRFESTLDRYLQGFVIELIRRDYERLLLHNW